MKKPTLRRNHKALNMKWILLSLSVLLMYVSAYSNETQDLKYIGMPVGGIGAGQVYLGGDGQLWYWDIFNVSMLNPGNEGGHRFYINPQAQENKFENGFGLTIKQGDKTFYRALNQSGFSDITFKGEYPVGKVKYSDPSLPVIVNLEAYSPFIPTDADNSGLPLTVLEYTITNNQDTEIEVEITGWLQNMCGFFTAKQGNGKHLNSIKMENGCTRLICKSTDDLNDLPDWGSMSLTLLEEGKGSVNAQYFNGLPLYFTDDKKKEASMPVGNKLVGSISGSVKLTMGESKTLTYLLSWYFPNVHRCNAIHRIKDLQHLRRYYSAKFRDAAHVSDYVIENKWLLDASKKWNQTWYNSNLPNWFLHRTFVNVSTLATNASIRFHDVTGNPENDGRFYSTEGVYLGEGTCTHVSHYEQALGRVFPNMARQLREQTDLGLSFQENGIIAYRGEFSKIGRHDGRGYAVDGHAGTILRIFREHTMSPNNEFLTKNWVKIKKTIQYMIDHDAMETGQADGILEGVQYNTLDRIWYGKITWISGLYAAALRAGAEMASEVDDKKYAKKCSKIANLAFENISAELFNGEYFIQKLDQEHLDAPNSNIGCHTDQLLGQYWATQTGLGNILPKDKIKLALQSIMKYNYTDNYGDYLAKADIPIKRWYADEDEPGTIMCTFPLGGADKAPGKINSEWEKLVVGYFSEIWTGQEHQLAATLIAHGMIEEGLKVVQAVEKRYAPERRNPYNEIEYGNHYTRAMSGYAPFVAASGFTYNGPKEKIGFHPMINPENFKSAFITAEGWGLFTQMVEESQQSNKLIIRYGNLNLKQVHLKSNLDKATDSVVLNVNGKVIQSKWVVQGQSLKIDFERLNLRENDQLLITIK